MKVYIIMLNNSPMRVVINNEEMAKELLFEMRTDYEKRLNKKDDFMSKYYWHIREVGGE